MARPCDPAPRPAGAVSAHAGAHFPSRTLAALIFLGVCNHVTLSGARVAVSLDALDRGASAATVGVLVALFALLPVVLAVAVGRVADHIGVRRPMLWGSADTAVRCCRSRSRDCQRCSRPRR